MLKFGRESRTISLWGQLNKFSFFFNLSVEKVETYRVLLKEKETYLCGVEQTNFLNKFFGSESRESRNVPNGIEQTSLQFFKKCRSSKSRKSKHI